MLPERLPRIEFIGVPKAARQSLAEHFFEWRPKVSRSHIPGERAKTDNEFKMIKDVVSWVQEDMEKHDVKATLSSAPEEYHFLSKDAYSKLRDTAGSDAAYNSLSGIIIVNDESGSSNVEKISGLIHETIHKAADQSVCFQDVGGEKSLHGRAFGFLREYGEDRVYFRAWNEIVVECLTVDILQKKVATLSEEEQWEKYQVGYDDKYAPGYTLLLPLLNDIVNGVVKKEGIEPSRVWNMFVKSQYSGDLRSLSFIERAFGPRALKILATMDLHGGNNQDIADTYFKFFKAPTGEERNKLADDLLKKS